MFERFTDRARRAVVLAQEEARGLNHNYIGTEHILLGLIHEGEGVAAKALDSLGTSLEAVRAQVQASIGQGQQAPTGPRDLRLTVPSSPPRRSADPTSAPSTSCSASSVRARAWRRRCSSSSAPTSPGCASRSSS